MLSVTRYLVTIGGRGSSILHQLELTIGRNEGNGSVLVELAQTDTTMEGAIIDLFPRPTTRQTYFDTRNLALGAGLLLALVLIGDQQLVVQTYGSTLSRPPYRNDTRACRKDRPS